MRTRGRDKQTRARRLLFIGLSAVLHLNLALVIASVISVMPDGCSPDDSYMPLEVALVPPDEVKLDQPQLDEQKLEEEERKEREKERDIKGQVVDLPRPQEEQRPDDARFLSEYDSKVKQETKGPQVPYRPGPLVPDRPVARRNTTRPPTPREQRKVARKVMKLAMRTRPELPKSELPESDSGDEPARVEQPESKVPKGPPRPRVDKQAGPRKQLTLKDLELSDRELSRALGSRVNDYLKGVKKGKQTLLNSKRWRFASFFNRVKRQVAQNWHPDVVYRRRDPTGNVYGFKDRLTILRVRLTPEGRLTDLHLEKASGVGFLDDEAMSAFRAAEPFPNPPKGLVDKDTGQISFRFGFLFEISRRPNFRIFRFK